MKNNNWIKVEDDIPEFNTDVLVYLGKGRNATIMQLKRIAQYKKFEDAQLEWSGAIGNASFVTHWQSLPEIPE